MKKIIGAMAAGHLLLAVSLTCVAETSAGARHYLQTCLSLAQVSAITGLALTQSSQASSPQDSCSYNDSEQLSKQSRVIYGRDSGYRVAFGASDIMQKVPGLGNFAEFDLDAGTLYVNVGSDGLTFEGRKGKQKLALEKLKALAEKVLQQP